MGRVEGKVALVTGAASGIGRACAITLAREGAQVVLADVQDARGQDVAAEIEASGGKAIFLRQDVASEDDWAAIVATIAQRFGRLDILINNAGIAVGGKVTEISLDDWRRQQAVNVEGVFLGVKHTLPLMRRSGEGGSIVNISSVAGLKGAANLSPYCASKGAVRLFSKAVALECAQEKDGVRCNSVHPGIIETPIWTGFPGLPLKGNAPDLEAMTAVGVPLGRPGAPEDIANGVLWLASDESRYVTGSELVIDGGYMTR